MDAAVFTETMARGRAALRAGDEARAGALLDEALGLWADPLEGLGDLAFTDAARADLAERQALALSDLATAHLRSGRPATPGWWPGGCSSARPFDEHAWGLVARALYAEGRQDEALAELRAARRLLREELGLDASPELAELEARSSPRPEPLPGASGAAGPGAAEDGGRAAGLPALPEVPDPFLGREALVDEVVGRLAAPGGP